MNPRLVLFGLLLVVAGAAAVLSFAALRDLALLCGFSRNLGWLLPVVVDAGAAAGSLVWLGGRDAGSARRFARSLALGLLTLSVAANALGHGLAAYRLAPPWWVVVVVSAIAPAVLGAVVHLAVLVGRPEPPRAELGEVDLDEEAELDDRFLDENGVSRWWGSAPSAAGPNGRDRAAELISAGVGRRRLSRELGMTEYEARQLLERTRRGQAGGPGETDDEGTNDDRQT